MFERVRQFASDERGLTSVEYALLLAFVGATVAVAMLALGEAVDLIMSDTTDSLTE